MVRSGIKKQEPKPEEALRICAVDPDTRVPGYAIFKGTTLVEYGTIRLRVGKTEKTGPEFFETVKGLADRTDALVIELQFVIPGKPETAKSIMSLAASRGKIEVFWNMQAKRICRIHAYRWQNEVLTSGRGQRSLKREEVQIAVKQSATQIAGETIVNADVASAICLGFYFARLHRMNGELAFKIAAETKKREKKITVRKRTRTDHSKGRERRWT